MGIIALTMPKISEKSYLSRLFTLPLYPLSRLGEQGRAGSTRSVGVGSERVEACGNLLLVPNKLFRVSLEAKSCFNI